MPRRQPEQHGPAKPRVSSPTTSRSRGSPPGSSQRGISPNTMRRARDRIPGQPQLREHPVDTVRTLADLVEEQHASCWRIERVTECRATRPTGSACRRPACRPPLPSRSISSCGCAISPDRLRRAQAAKERVAIVAGLAARQPPFDHRPVKRDDAAGQRQPGQQRRVVAVADERLGRPGEYRRIEQRQQLHAAIAAAHGDERGDRRDRPMRVGMPRRGSAGVPASIAALRSNTDVVVDRFEPERAKLGDAGLELVARKALAGATTATRSPGRSARGFRMLARRTSPSRRPRPGARRAPSTARRAAPDSGCGRGGEEIAP